MALRHREEAMASALIPRLGRRGGFLPWALLITGAAASSPPQPRR